MKKPLNSLLVCILFLLSGTALTAQVSINQDNSSADPSSMLDVKSTDKGFLMPRLTTSERDAIVDPAAGLVIYNVQDSCFNYYTGVAWVKDCGRDFSADQKGFLSNSNGGSDDDRGEGIGTDASGNIYVTGRFRGTANFGATTLSSIANEDIFLAKYNPFGEVLWAVQLEGSPSAPGGFLQNIRVDAAGNSYLTGSFEGTKTFGSYTLTAVGFIDVFIAKFDPNGQVLWAVSAGGSNSGILSVDSRLDASNNLYITGGIGVLGTQAGLVNFGPFTLDPQTDGTVFVAKYNSSGQALWAVSTGGTGNGTGFGNLGIGIGVDPAGNSYVTGGFTGTATFGSSTLTSVGAGDVFLAKFDPTGQALWAVRGGGSDNDFGIKVIPDASGNVIVMGKVGEDDLSTPDFGTINLSITDESTFLAKYDPAGQVIWAIAGNGNITSRDIALDITGNIYLAGELTGTINLGTGSISPTGSGDAFVAKFNPAGQALWTQKAGGSSGDEANAITVHGDSKIYATGFFEGVATFGTTTLTSTGDEDVFLWPMDVTDGGDTFESNSNLSDSQDADSDPTNEIQSLSIIESTLSLSNGGGSISLPNTADNLGNHMATENLQLKGNWLSNDGDNEGLFIDTDGNNGIGTSTPSAALDIEGNLQLKDGTQGQNKILTSDADGNASWQSLSAESLLLGSVNPPVEGDCLEIINEYTLGGNLNVYSLAASGNYVYASSQSEDFQVVDVSDPINPEVVGDLSVGPTPILTLSGNYAIVVDRAANNNFRMIDVSDPTNPIQVGSLSIGSVPNFVRALGDYAYVVDSDSDDLKIIDISDPTDPTQVGSLGLGSNPRRVEVLGDYAYVVDSDSDDLKIIDVEDPANPMLITNLVFTESTESVDVSGDYAYVTTRNALKVIDVSDPSNPTEIESLGLSNPRYVEIAGSFAYVVEGGVNLVLVNISNPTNLVQLANVSVRSNVITIASSSNFVFLAGLDQLDELVIIEVDCLVTPKLLGIDPLTGQFVETEQDNLGDHMATENLQLKGNWLSNDGDNEGLFVDTDGNNGIGTSTPSAALDIEGDLQIKDGTQGQNKILTSDADGNASWQTLNPQSLFVSPLSDDCPEITGRIRFGGGTLRIAVEGDYAYVTSGESNLLRVLNVSDPTNPTQIDSLSLRFPRWVAVRGNFVYLVDAGTDEFLIFDVSTPANPTEVGSLSIGDQPEAFSLLGNYAYLVDLDSDDLKVIDVSDPSNPTQVGSLGLGPEPKAVVAQGDYVYVTDTQVEDLKVINVSDPGNPTQVGSISLTGLVRSLVVKGNYAYIVDGNNLRVVDVSDPTNPVDVNSVSVEPINNPTAGPYSITLSGEYLFVINEFSDLSVFNLISPANPIRVSVLNPQPTRPGFSAVSGDYLYITSVQTNDLTIANLSCVFDNPPLLNLVEKSLVNVGDITATSFTGDGSGLTNIPGDNLGDHTATMALQMSDNNILDANTIEVNTILDNEDNLVIVDDNLRTAGDVTIVGDDLYSNVGSLRLNGEDNVFISMDYNNNDNDNRSIRFGKNDEGSETNWMELMRITEEGKVGIGTASPAERLSVVGVVRGANLIDELDYVEISHDGSNGYINTAGEGTLEFRQDGDTKMSLTDAGRLGIGITSPDYALEVHDRVTGDDEYVMKIENTATGLLNRKNGLLIQTALDSYAGGVSPSARFIEFMRPDGTKIGNIRQGGSGSVAYSVTSDQRLKENIRPTRFSLEDLLQIEVRDYNYKTDAKEQVETGFIAQQLHMIYPQAVGIGGEDAKTDPWTVDYSRLSPILVKAVQDLASRNQALEEELEQVKKEKDALEAKVRQLQNLEARLQALETSLLKQRVSNQASETTNSSSN